MVRGVSPRNTNIAAIERRLESGYELRTAEVQGEATGVARERMPVSRLACLNCGRMDRLGFADETRRQSRYGIAVAIVGPCQEEIVSKVMQLSPENVRALYVSARGRQTDARSECWRMLVPQLVRIGVVKLTIEQIDEGGKLETAGTSAMRCWPSIGSPASLTSMKIKSASRCCGSQTRSPGVRDREAPGGRGSLRSCIGDDLRKRETRLQTVRRGTRPTSAATALASPLCIEVTVSATCPTLVSGG